jgi:hypothetical protein
MINIVKNIMPGLSLTAEKGGRRGERTGQLDSCWQLFIPLLLFLHLGLLQHGRLFKNVKLSAIATALGCSEVAAVPSDVMLCQSEATAVPDGFTAVLTGNDTTSVFSRGDVTGSLSRSDVTAIIDRCDVTGALGSYDVTAVLSDVTAVLDVVTAVLTGKDTTSVLCEGEVTASLSRSDVTAIIDRCVATGSLGRYDVTAVPSDVTTSAALLLSQVSPGGLQRAAEAVWRGPLQVLEAGQPREVGGVLSQLRF